MQQWRKMRGENSKDNPLLRFWKDLTLFIVEGNKDGTTDTTVMLDANADHSDACFAQLLVDCELSDMHDNPMLEIAPATYFRGTRRIDSILGS
jgi:hypothetical protein